MLKIKHVDNLIIFISNDSTVQSENWFTIMYSAVTVEK